MSIQTKRVYEPAASQDGARFLVDRMWPRGVKKDALRMEAWLKELAPSNTLRKWFAHDPKKWTEFKRRYARELKVHPGELQRLLKAAQTGDVTLLYSARDTERNNAMALQTYLNRKLNIRDKQME